MSLKTATLSPTLSHDPKWFEFLRSCYQLTKPTIVLLFGLTGLSAMVMEGGLLTEPLRFGMVLLGILLTAGSANALNQYIDRDIDAIMERTRKKRPLPDGRITPNQALGFSIITGVLATFLLAYYGSAQAAFWGVATIAFYIGVYTLWLKRRSPYNIVIGGAAGATAPLIGWAAGHGHLSLASVIMFVVIFMWTPAHFWALALCLKDEYAEANVPMLPVVKGVDFTKRQIFYYTVATVPLPILLYRFSDLGKIFLVSSILLGAVFLKYAWNVLMKFSQKNSWKMFGFSILYLLALFAVMIVDAVAAEPIPNELKGVGITEQFGAQTDLNLTFKDEKGTTVPLRSVVDGKKPTLLLLAYYGCPNLCNLFLNGTTDALKKMDWAIGENFNVLTISIDPREDSALAVKKKAAHLEAYNRPQGSQWHFWVNDTKAAPDATNIHVKDLANEVGFGYHFDKEQDQYAHSAAMILLTPEGKVSRYLYGIQFSEKDLKLALVEAGGRKIGTMIDHILLFCYHYDPKTQKYSLFAQNIMRAGGGLTVLLLGGVLIGFRRRNRKENSNVS